MPKKPKKPTSKTIRIPGASVTYTPTRSNEKFIKGLAKRMVAKAEAREQRAAKRAANPPDLTPHSCLVAYIDILGFGHEIERAKTKEDLEKVHRKIKIVQKEFGKHSAADDPDEQKEINSDFGRRVIAISDAVVVATTTNCPATGLMGGHDFLGFSIFDFLIAQTRCIAQGIFVRGAISHGPFFFEEDVLLSPPLARAYELESRHAEYPLIVVPEETRQAILGTPSVGFTAPDADALPDYFKRLGRKKWRGQALYYLDYAGVMINEPHRGMLPEDREERRQALKRKDYDHAEAVNERSAQKDAAYFLRGHRKRLEEAYAATGSERVRKKYRWLMKYHNQSFRQDIAILRDELIDLAQYQPPTARKKAKP